MGYTAESAGMVLSVAALILLVELPIVGRLTAVIQARYLMAFGWAALTVAMFYSTRRIDLLMSFSSATWLRIAQYVPMGFIFIPATMVAYLGVPQEKSNSVAGLINFVRNIGASVGTSAVTTVLARRTQFHQLMLSSHTAVADRMFQSTTTGMTGRMQQSGRPAQFEAYARLYGTMQRQASTLSYIDTFWLLGIITGIMFFLSFLLRKNHLHKADAQALAH
jgi:DHA2 family multidrug resistance protein